MNRTIQILCCGLFLILSGCATTPETEPVSPAELKAAVTEVEVLKQATDADQAELLSYREYRRGEQWKLFDVREESMGRKGGDADTMRVHYNEQGVLEGDPNEAGPGLQLSMAWTGGGDGAGRAMESWLELIHADGAVSANPSSRPGRERGELSALAPE